MRTQTMIKAVHKSVFPWIVRFPALLNRELGSFREVEPPVAHQHLAPTLPSLPASIGETDGLFADALRDSSNLEMDWIWLASRVTCETERRYCLERALYINPDSEVARRMLARGI